MLAPGIITFLKKLEKHNDRSWFEANRPEYEMARASFMDFVAEVIKGLAAFEPALGELEPGQCVFRINRDVRFSKNKNPYKNNMSAYFNRAGKKGNGAGYYIHIQPGGSFAAAGIWQPEAPDLSRIRQEIDYNLADWKKIVESRSFRKTFSAGIGHNDTLSRPPKGYTEDNPAIEYLKLKSFETSAPFTDAATTQKDFTKTVVGIFRSLQPFTAFLNHALD